MKDEVIIFTGGGTGGHIYPGLAVIESLRAKGYSGRLAWIGSRKELDRKIVEGAGVEYFAVPSGKLRRSLSPRNLSDIAKVAAGYFASKSLLKGLKPLALFSKGGYVSVPPCRAAHALGIPYVTHESDVTPGLATRLNSKYAARVLTSWESTSSFFSSNLRDKITLVGNPVRASLFSGDAQRGRAYLGAMDSRPIVLFLGGSQGARQVNELVRAILPALADSALIVHQTGKLGAVLPDTEVERELSNSVSENPKGADTYREGRYRAFEYIGEELPDILAAATIVAGRAGAGTIWEAANLGKPMVLIPLEGSGTRGDQVENAKAAERVGAAIVLTGGQANPSALLETLDQLLKDGAKRATMGTAALNLASGRPGSSNMGDPVSSKPRSSDLAAEILLSVAGK